MSKKRAASPDSDTGFSSDDDIDNDNMYYIPRDMEDEDEFMLEELFDTPPINKLADKMSKCNEIVHVFEDLLHSLANYSIDQLPNLALNHFNKVECVWRNYCFLRALLKEDQVPCHMRRYRLVASRKLSSFLIGMIRKDPSFRSIFIYSDNSSMMRNALSILIGYFSNEDMIAPLVLALGRRSLGLKCDSEDASLSVVKGDNTLAWGEEQFEDKIRTEFSTHFEGMPVFPIIADLLQDASIKKLADQLMHIDEAVTLCEQVLKSLRNDVPVLKDHFMLRDAVFEFWFDPDIIILLIKALKQSTSLVSVLKKYSRGAQIFRCVERIIRIRKDPLLGSILGIKEPDQRLSGALSILFGYWSDIDVIRPLPTFRVAQRSTQLSEGVDLTKYDGIQLLEYFANGLDDVEGLENVLADKYSKDPKEKSDLLNKIVRSQMSAKKNATEKSSEYWYMVSVLLTDGEVVYFGVERFPPESRR